MQLSEWLGGLDCNLYTLGNSLLFTSSKVSATTPSTLVCVSIETTTGKAGRMLMASQWAREAQLQAAVCHGKAESPPPWWLTFFHRMSRAGQDLQCVIQIKHLYTHRVNTHTQTHVTCGISIRHRTVDLETCQTVLTHARWWVFFFYVVFKRLNLSLYYSCGAGKKTCGDIKLVTVLFNITSPRVGTHSSLEMEPVIQ